MGESCASDLDCDVSLACRRNTRPPHETTCRVPAQTGEFCDKDYDCEMDHFCHYESAANYLQGVKKCLEMYIISDDTVPFGWVGGNTLQDWMFNGRMCKSGLAAMTGVNEGRCGVLTTVS